MMSRKRDEEGGALTITELTRRLKEVLEEAFPELWIRGEVSNLRIQSSGHAYFTLKDEGAQLPVIMFRADVLRVQPVLREGARISAFGRISVYEPRGAYQFVARVALDDGLGRLRAEFEALKVRLAGEGLFAAERKRPLPHAPRAVGFVTSPTGAAIQDFISVLRRRGWKGRMVLFPVKVQGDGAGREIAARIREGGDSGFLDLLVVGRGGGSIEDLWSFNEEAVARAIAACGVPVISAVGHETDFTLADFAADKRAETPTAAAELISSLRIEAVNRVDAATSALERAFEEGVGERIQNLDNLEARLGARSPGAFLRHESMRLGLLNSKLETALRRSLDSCVHLAQLHAGALTSRTPRFRVDHAGDRIAALGRALELAVSRRNQTAVTTLASLEARLCSTGIDATLRRGFAIVKGESGALVSNAAAVTQGRPLTLRFADGEAAASGGHPVLINPSALHGA